MAACIGHTKTISIETNPNPGKLMNRYFLEYLKTKKGNLKNKHLKCIYNLFIIKLLTILYKNLPYEYKNYLIFS